MISIPLALYIHIPWCVRKCPYCDFNSHKLTRSVDEKTYIKHLLKDFEYDYASQSYRPIQSIFFGGGTPSLFSPQSIGHILNHLRAHANLTSDCEITLEANPGTAEQQKFADFYQAGINRLSIGVQSFAPNQLQILGRIHNSDEAKRAIDLAQQAGFKRLNLDIMFALSGQTIAQALDDLKQAVEFNPEHISWYQLTLEPNTAFFNHPPPLPTDDEQVAIYEAGCDFLRSQNYHQYEISAWTRQQPCQHNFNYWQFGDYIGIGAGAHGKLTQANGKIIRTSKYRTPGAYQRAQGKYHNPYIDQQHTIKPSEQAFEFMMNALRLQAGVPSQLISERTQITLASLQPKLAYLNRQGLLQANYHQRLQTTKRGFAMLNNILSTFLD